MQAHAYKAHLRGEASWYINAIFTSGSAFLSYEQILAPETRHRDQLYAIAIAKEGFHFIKAGARVRSRVRVGILASRSYLFFQRHLLRVHAYGVVFTFASLHPKATFLLAVSFYHKIKSPVLMKKKIIKKIWRKTFFENAVKKNPFRKTRWKKIVHSNAVKKKIHFGERRDKKLIRENAVKKTLFMSIIKFPVNSMVYN